VGKNLGSHIYHSNAIVDIWEMLKKNSTWAIRLVEHQVPPFEFYFVKNGTKDTVQRMPIHDMARWAPLPNNVILFLEDPCKKKLVGLVCLVKKLDDTLTSTNVKKGFKVKDIQDFNVMAIFEKWIKFKEFIELEREDTTRNSQGGF
jgi:hypothetical protein